ncbi:MAG: FtsW/RodA/SpoVE family cell cycle protein, partial [Planctomycetes bacterium]|nr:FtsW/RodA/SpoVE family cell cycle protein [Planctomycetota bacterium]
MAHKDEAARTILVAAVSALLGISTVMIYSTTARGDGPLVSPTFIKQMMYVAFGIASAFALGYVDYHVILRYNRVILAVSAMLLVLVLVPGIGHRVNGASRWLRLGPVGLQPSEPVKIALVIFLAAFLAERTPSVRAFRRTFVPAVAVTGVLCFLVLLEPDIGTSILLGLVAAVVLFVAGAKITHILAPAVAVVPIMAFVVSRGYARTRIEAWLDPWKDPA